MRHFLFTRHNSPLKFKGRVWKNFVFVTIMENWWKIFMCAATDGSRLSLGDSRKRPLFDTCWRVIVFVKKSFHAQTYHMCGHFKNIYESNPLALFNCVDCVCNKTSGNAWLTWFPLLLIFIFQNGYRNGEQKSFQTCIIRKCPVVNGSVILYFYTHRVNLAFIRPLICGELSCKRNEVYHQKSFFFAQCECLCSCVDRPSSDKIDNPFQPDYWISSGKNMYVVW